MKINKAPVEPVINEQADRELLRIIRIYGGITSLLVLIMPFTMAFVNTPASSVYRDRHFLDMLSVLVVLTPFFMGIQKMTVARLRIGRGLLEKRQWQQAIAALDWFAAPTQRFLDRTGEAHYLLSLAYQGLGDRAKAEKMRDFVRKHRSGPWAQKLQGGSTLNRGTANPGVVLPKPSPKSLGKKRRRF